MALIELLVVLICGLPPQLDAEGTLGGARIIKPAADELPHQMQTSEAMHLLLTPIEQTYGGGGLDLADGPMLSLHGSSWTQLRYMWGHLELSHPARAGLPLIDLPEASWQALRIGDLWQSRPTLHMHLAPPAHSAPSAWAHIGYGAPAGNSSWVPPHLFDRDPAYPYGAPRVRRGIRARTEAMGHMHIPVGGGTAFVLGEHIEQRQRYLTLAPLDAVERNSVVVLWQRLWAGWPVVLHGAWQQAANAFDGATWRQPATQTRATARQALVVGLEGHKKLAADAKVQLGVGAGVAHDESRSNTSGAYISDLADEASSLRPWVRPSTLRTGYVGAHAAIVVGHIDNALPNKRATAHERSLMHLQRAAEAPLQTHHLYAGHGPTLMLTGRSRWAGWTSVPQAAPDQFGLTWQNAPARLLRFDPPQKTVTQLLTAQLLSQLFVPLEGQLSIQVTLGLDGGGRPGIPTPQGFWAPSAGVAAVKMLRGWQGFALVRQDPEAITSQWVDFVTPHGASGSSYVWSGGDIESTSRRGALLDRFGAPFHQQDSHLRRPQHTRISLGGQTPALFGVQLGLRGTAHVLWQRYQVRRIAQATTQTTTFIDPGGDGRGEATPNGQLLYPEAESSLALGRDAVVYVLQNASKPSHYLGLELEISTAPERMFYATLLGAAYLSAGAAPFGQGPFRNDPGVIDEAEGSVNERIHGFGRYDHDRAFALKLQAGVRPRKDMSLALLGRYRDGQTTTRIVVDDNLPQGPTALMAVDRGKPRYTFRMSWDVRFAWALRGRLAGMKLLCDVYNVFGSATEISEDMRTGPTFRRATEAVPQRSVWVALQGALTP